MRIWRISLVFVVLVISLVFAIDARDGSLPSRLRFYFIHLSCGENWLADDNGGLRKALNKAETDAGRRFKVFDSATGNTDQREWVSRFNDSDDWKNYNIVAFKSCFPASHIDSNKMLREYKKVYRKNLAQVFRANPNILFVIVTAPPQVPNETNRSCADRARAFNNWLKGGFLKTYNRQNPDLNNVMVFDFFNVLADDHNMLKAEYRSSEDDSHPNKKGNMEATKEFVPLLSDAVDLWADSR
jgi:hypothetical protein